MELTCSLFAIEGLGRCHVSSVSLTYSHAELKHVM